jgi:ABC-type Fe3+ transport system permease subunit
MGPTIAAATMIALLSAWHLRTRRHPNWRRSRDARFYIGLGYPSVAIAVCFLADPSGAAGWNWVLGNVWALVASTVFVCGFQALDQPPRTGGTPGSPTTRRRSYGADRLIRLRSGADG